MPNPEPSRAPPPAQIALLLIEQVLCGRLQPSALPNHTALSRSPATCVTLMNAVVELALARLAEVKPGNDLTNDARQLLTTASEIVTALNPDQNAQLNEPLSQLAALQVKMLSPYSSVNQWLPDDLVAIEAGFRLLDPLLQLETAWCTEQLSEDLTILANSFLNSKAIDELLESNETIDGGPAVEQLVSAVLGFCDDKVLDRLAHVAYLINRKYLYFTEHVEHECDDDEDSMYVDDDPLECLESETEAEIEVDQALDCWNVALRLILVKLTDASTVTADTIVQIERIFADSLKCTLLQPEALDAIAVHAPNKLGKLLEGLLQKTGTEMDQVSPYSTLQTLLHLGIIRQRYPEVSSIQDPTEPIVSAINEYYSSRSARRNREKTLSRFNALFAEAHDFFSALQKRPDHPEFPFLKCMEDKFKAIHEQTRKHLGLPSESNNPGST